MKLKQLIPIWHAAVEGEVSSIRRNDRGTIPTSSWVTLSFERKCNNAPTAKEKQQKKTVVLPHRSSNVTVNACSPAYKLLMEVEKREQTEKKKKAMPPSASAQPTHVTSRRHDVHGPDLITRREWSCHTLLPIIRWLDTKGIGFCYSDWEIVYTGLGKLCSVSQKGIVRGYDIVGSPHSYVCDAAMPSSSLTNSIALRVTSERRHEHKANMRACGGTECAKRYGQLRQHRVYRCNDVMQLHLAQSNTSASSRRPFTIWVEICMNRYECASQTVQEECTDFITNVARHLQRPTK
jgi:hypothetical protein